jgi:hypothetical protein
LNKLALTALETAKQEISGILVKPSRHFILTERVRHIVPLEVL